VPGKGWFILFRFYGPLEPFFDKTGNLPTSRGRDEQTGRIGAWRRRLRGGEEVSDSHD
jgi:hypothetical protein